MKLRPEDAAGNDALGAVLVAAQDIPSKPFQPCNRGSRHVPIIEAHCNLGFALAGQEDFEGPAEQFRLASQLQPEDANVEANLEAARAQTGRYLEGKSHFERALQIEPNQPIAKENLEALQKEMNSHESNCLVPLPLFDLALFDLALSGNDFVIPSVARNLLFAGAGRRQVARRFAPRNAKALSISIFYDPMLLSSATCGLCSNL